MKKRKPIIIAGVILLLCLIVAVFFAITANSAERRLSHQLELGQRYLDELDYERAIVAYEAAIDIDPKCEEAYLALADIYVAQDNMEKAVEVLEEGYFQTESEMIQDKLEEVTARMPGEDNKQSAEDALETGKPETGKPETGKPETESGQVSGSSQAPESSQPADGGAGDGERLPVDENDPFVQFVNAPFTDQDGFGDVASADAAAAYAESNGYVIGSLETIPVGNLYLYYEGDSEYFDPETDEMGVGSLLNIATGDNVYNAGVSGTEYYYSNQAGTMGYSITTTLEDVNIMSAGDMPAIGGFSGFLEEYGCLSMESILKTIGLDDEELLSYALADNSGYDMQVETPYGTSDIHIFNFLIDETNYDRYLSITFPTGTDAPFQMVYIQEGTRRSPFDNTLTYYIMVGGDSAASGE